MNVFNKITALKTAIALAAVLAMNGTALAKKGNSGVSADLSADGTSVTLSVTVGCDSITEGATGALSVYILQPSGRLSVSVSSTRPSIVIALCPTKLYL